MLYTYLILSKIISAIFCGRLHKISLNFS